MSSSIGLIFFFYFFLLLISETVHCSECQKVKNCKCYIASNENMYACPNIIDSNIRITELIEKKHVSIDCSNTDTDLEFPELNFNESSRLTILDCYLNKDNSLQHIYKNLNFTNITVFVLEMFRNSSVCSAQNLNLTKDFLKGLETVENISLKKNLIRHIENDAFREMENLVDVDLSNNCLDTISSAFSVMTNVRAIDFSSNKITNIPDDAFLNMTNLKTLHLWSNNLTTLSNKLFSSLHNLALLELSTNGIKDLPEDIFIPLSSLRAISLQGNHLSNLQRNIFKHNTALQNIRLSRNKISVFHNSTFANLVELKELDVSTNQLKVLPYNLFSGLKKLVKIDLMQNLLEELPDDLFRGLEKLEQLDLRQNKLTDISPQIFYGLTSLKILNLENNSLTSIGRNAFNSLQELRELSLAKNRISYLDNTIFDNLIALEKLDLSHNNIVLTHNPLNKTPFGNLLKLQDLNLEKNGLEFIPDDLINNKIYLKRLNLASNYITKIEVFELKGVTTENLDINLRNNKIDIINFSAVVQVSKLLGDESLSIRTIDISNNPILCDCHAYNLLQYVHKKIEPAIQQRFNFKYDVLKCASPVDLFGENLTSIGLGYLNCELVDQECSKECIYFYYPHDKRMKIDCSYRNLTSAPALCNHHHGTYSINKINVHLEGNLLTQFTNNTIGYDNVTGLYMQGNQLTEINWIPPKLETLELHGNNFSRLEYETLVMLNTTHLNSLTLHENPWICDCSAVDFTTVLRNNLIKQIHADNLTCHDSNMLLVNLTEVDLCETNTTLIIILGSVLFSFLIILTVSMALYYKFEYEIKVWLFAHNIFFGWITEEELDKDKLYDAFLSYSHKDEDFIIKHLVPELEGGSNPYKLCIHIRDWIAGEFITTQITESVENSRRTIVVLSPHFLESVWSKMEFRTAHTKAMTEGRTRVIVILYGDVDINSNLDDELKVYLKTNTYVKWGDPWFWQKLKYAMPHSRLEYKPKSKKMENIMVTIDKLDLLNSPSTPNTGTPPAVSLDPLLLKGGNPLQFKPDNNIRVTPPAECGLILTHNK